MGRNLSWGPQVGLSGDPIFQLRSLRPDETRLPQSSCTHYRPPSQNATSKNDEIPRVILSRELYDPVPYFLRTHIPTKLVLENNE